MNALLSLSKLALLLAHEKDRKEVLETKERIEKQFDKKNQNHLMAFSLITIELAGEMRKEADKNIQEHNCDNCDFSNVCEEKEKKDDASIN